MWENQVEEQNSAGSSASEDDDSAICKITDNSWYGVKVQAELKLKFGNTWKMTKCDLDTGADVCVIGISGLAHILNASLYNLKCFGGSNVEVFG